MFQVSEVLRKVPFFQSLGKDGIDFIIERLKFKPFEANETICQAGDPGDKMYIIINGNVKVVVQADPGGEENIVAQLKTGDYFGEMSLLTGEPRSASVVTTEPSEMFILNKSDFDVIIERFPSISLSMSKIMSQRLRDTNQKAAQRGSADVARISGDLSQKPLEEVMKACEKDSLNGRVMIKNGEQVGELLYARGELQKVVLGDYPEDQALDMMLNWQEGRFMIEQRPIQVQEKAKAAAAAAPEQPCLLIVNNSMVVQKLLQRAFESMGYEVYTVETAAKASKMIRSLEPHLIISDTKLPDAEGVSFLKTYREISQTPVVLLTEASGKDQIRTATSDYSDIHFTNSQEVGEVVKIVESILKNG